MRIVLSIGCAIFLTVPSYGQAQVSPKCSVLAADYDHIEKAMASRMADGIGDNSAPRATNRALEDSNSLAQAGIIITLMQANKCPLPDHAPSVKRYFSAALSCATDRLKAGANAPSCEMKNWKAE